MKKFLKPSEFMKKRRPYLYSDSSKAGAYQLSRSEFSHYLDTLTERNQHKDFEIFCRHLCERILCPNLRTQTGPEGGGDGKIDTETYTVSTEIAQRWHAGDANAGSERWGFAFSTMKAWTAKVRSDIKGIVETGREYDRIYFVTNRPVKANKCHDEEHNLTNKYGIPVTILDREWIIEEIFKNNLQSIACRDLGAGRLESDKSIVGPNDYRRNQRLTDIERRIMSTESEVDDQSQLVSDTFKAVKLSRELERPRYETEGRFKRAINVATKSGTHSQILRAKYEYAWTMLWWYDDIEQLNQTYEDIEEIVSKFDSAEDLSKLCNLLTVLEARVSQGWESSDHLDLVRRRKRLRSKLYKLSQDKSQPNNALYAETLLALSMLTNSEAEDQREILDRVWGTFSDIIDRAEGLGEYPVKLVDDAVEEISSFVPESTTLDHLTEKLAEFMGQREKEGKAGKLFFQRGKLKLDTQLHTEAIWWLGKASICFLKEEYKEEQFETLSCLALAYHDAGLHWAARSVCLAALVIAGTISAERAETKMETILPISLLALLSLKLGRVPDLMLCVYWLHGLAQALPLEDKIKSYLDKEFEERDMQIACFLSGIEAKFIPMLSNLPDILEALRLINSKTILMYRLGRAHELREYDPVQEGNELIELADLANLAAAQPVSHILPKVPWLNNGQSFYARTVIIGVVVEFMGNDTAEDILLCETCIGAIESFLATAFFNKIFPKTEKLIVHVKIKEDLNEPELKFDSVLMVLNLNWPKKYSVSDANATSIIKKYLLELCAYVADVIAFVPDAENFIKHIVLKENLFERAVSFSFAHFSQNRTLGGYLVSLSDLSFLTRKSYPPLQPLPEIVPTSPKIPNDDSVEEDTKKNNLHSLKHDEVVVSSIINTHLWDEAVWRGVVYAHSGVVDTRPPLLGLAFKNRKSALSIFKEWNDKFGRKDVNDRIKISIIRGICSDNVHHYRVIVTPSFESFNKLTELPKVFVGLSHKMEPKSSRNLDGFLRQFKRHSRFYLVPAVILDGRDEPELVLDYSILSRNLHVKQAWEVDANDCDAVAVMKDDKIIIPKVVK